MDTARRIYRQIAEHDGRLALAYLHCGDIEQAVWWARKAAHAARFLQTIS